MVHSHWKFKDPNVVRAIAKLKIPILLEKHSSCKWWLAHAGSKKDNRNYTVYINGMPSEAAWAFAGGMAGKWIRHQLIGTYYDWLHTMYNILSIEVGSVETQKSPETQFWLRDWSWFRGLKFPSLRDQEKAQGEDWGIQCISNCNCASSNIDITSVSCTS